MAQLVNPRGWMTSRCKSCGKDYPLYRMIPCIERLSLGRTRVYYETCIDCYEQSTGVNDAEQADA